MSDYRAQAEQEMWDAAASVTPSEREYRYDVFVRDTGARCLSTDSYDVAVARAAAVDGYVWSVPLNYRVYDSHPNGDNKQWPPEWLKETGDGFSIMDRE